MLKNKSLILATLVVIILGCISIFYFKKPVLVEDSYNITVVNNTGEDIKSVGYESKKYSGGTIKADNSMIHNKEEMYLDIKESKFKILNTNKEDKTILSQEMNIDLNDKNYKVYVEKNKENELVFYIEEI